jgi:hypothetical protein
MRVRLAMPFARTPAASRYSPRSDLSPRSVTQVRQLGRPSSSGRPPRSSSVPRRSHIGTVIRAARNDGTRLIFSRSKQGNVALSRLELLTKPIVNFGCVWRVVGKNCCSVAVLASKLTKRLALSVRYLETKHLPNGLQNGGPPSPQSAARRAARTACVLGKLFSKDEARRIAAA